MRYQVFRPLDGVMTREGRSTRFLDKAVNRAAQLKGEVRPVGSLTPVWYHQTFLAPVQPAQPRLQPRKPLPCPIPRVCQAARQGAVTRPRPAKRV